MIKVIFHNRKTGRTYAVKQTLLARQVLDTQAKAAGKAATQMG